MLFVALAAVTWSCAAPEWMGSPEVNGAMFTAAVGSDCRVKHVPENGVAKLFRFLRSDVERSGRFDVHAGPLAARRHGLPGYRYDLTDRVDGVVIRQDMFLGSDEKERFVYATASKHVEASGNAGYLRAVTFRTDLVRLDGSDYLLRFENEVAVERPWFALPFLFAPIGKGITKEKFLLAREKLLAYLAPQLNQ